VQAEGEVLNPPDGVVVEGEVIRKNKMGMYVSYENAIRVIVPRDLHIGQKEFEDVEIGERVQVEIKKARFQVNDPYILAVGIFLRSLGKGAAAGAAAGEAAATNLASVDEELDEEEGGEGEGGEEEGEGEDAEEEEGSEAAEEEEGAEGEGEEEAEEAMPKEGRPPLRTAAFDL
jgi:DNA-directed RNA polymerase subunit E'/Rpb7